jgi:hypothetical protein
MESREIDSILEYNFTTSVLLNQIKPLLKIRNVDIGVLFVWDHHGTIKLISACKHGEKVTFKLKDMRRYCWSLL